MKRSLGNASRVQAVVICAVCIASLPASLCAQWSTASGGAIYYDGGNVGIGTASPGAGVGMAGGLTINGSGGTVLNVQSGGTNAFALNPRPDGSWTMYDNYSGSWNPSLASVGGRVGIGTTTPAGSLEIDSQGPTGATTLLMSNPVGTWGTVSAFNSYRFIQTISAAADGQFKSFNLGAGGLAIGYSNTPVYGSSDALYVNGDVGIGTTNPQYPLSVNGTIQAKEVIVNTGWSDYVFDPGYKLMPLPQVANYIKQHHHLPGVPSQAQVKQKGVSVGQMESTLLAKVEELTLQLIQVNKRAQRLEQENRELEQKFTQLAKREEH